MMRICTLFIAALSAVISYCCLLLLLLLPLGTSQQSYEIDTLVGLRFYQGEGGLASHVLLDYPYNVAFHPVTDELFIVDTYNDVIRKVDKTSGVITTVAGTPGISNYYGDGGPATKAYLFVPMGIAFSPDGESMYIADNGKYHVRMVKNGIITTVAGNGQSGFGSDGVLANSTSIDYISCVAVLPTTGELIIADSGNHRIRKVDSNGIISTIAGTGAITTGQADLGDNGPATSATMHFPSGVVANSDGDIFFADSSNYRIRKIDRTSGVITTVAGNGVFGASGDNVPATSAQLGVIGGLAINGAGDLFLADQALHCIRKVSRATQIITTVAGVCGYSNQGYLGENESAVAAKFNIPMGVAVSRIGEIAIADRNNYRVRKVTTDGIIHTVAGNGVQGFSGESGIAIDSKLNMPTSVAVTNDGEIVISDSGNQKIRKLDKNGVITAVAGMGVEGFSGDGGSALNAFVSNAGKVVVTSTGDVLFADTGNNRIRKVDSSSGTIVTIAGNGAAGFTGDGALATTAALNQPQSIACLNGEVYIADTGNHRVRKIIADGTIVTIAGTGMSGYSGDGDLAVNAMLNTPVDVMVSGAGEVFISEEGNHVVRKIDDSGIISTFAGTPGVSGYSGDGGSAVVAWLNSPRGLTINSDAELLIADTNNNVIRKVDNSGIISTVVTGLLSPHGVTHGRDGELYIVERDGQQITKVDSNGRKILIAGVSPVYGGPSDFHLPEHAPLAFVSSLSLLADNVLIVADTYNHMIKKIDINTKSVTPIVIGAALSYPRGTTIVNNEIYFADYGNHCIRKIDLNNGGLVSDVVGVCGNGGYSGDGTLATAQLFYPSSVVVVADGDMFIADSGNHLIRKVSGGVITTIAGVAGKPKFVANDVPALSGRLYEPTDLVIAPNGDSLYLSDHGNHCVRKIDLSSGIIKLVAGQCGIDGFDGDGGLATSALLSHPRGLTFTAAGQLLIADYGNSAIRQVDIDTGLIMTIAGVGQSVGYAGDNGSPTNAQLNRPTGIAVGTNGDYYIADFGNHLIRVVRPTCYGFSNKDSRVCSGHGLCVATDTCQCHSGYAGIDCSVANCFGTWSNESSACSGHGECVTYNNCNCDANYENYICSDAECPETNCLKVMESQPRDRLNCSVPTYSAQYPPEINVLNITWILNQFGLDIETETVTNPTDDYVPNVATMYDGDYTVSARMYYKTLLGEVRLRTASIERVAECSVCALQSVDNCRFTIGFDNHNIDNGKIVSIPRMIPFTIKLLDHDALNNDHPIEKLEIQWIYSQTSSETQSMGENISIGLSASRRELTISPIDPITGMNQNVTIDITCQYKLPTRSWTTISFKVHTTPSKDITPANGFEIQPSMGYALITPFALEAKHWQGVDLVYSFSLLDPIDNVERLLNRSTEPLFNTTLPFGSLPDLTLPLRLRVLDLVTGDYGYVEKQVRVEPYCEGDGCSCYGLLSNNSRVCSGNGWCIGYNKCQCHSGFVGDQCEMVISIEPYPVFEPLAGAVNIQKPLMVELMIKALNQQPINSLAAGAKFEWSLFDITANKQLDIIGYVKTGTNSVSKSIALKPNVLLPNNEYRLECNVTLSNPLRVGSSVLRFTSSSAPMGGSVQASPSKGKLLIDKFKLTTSDWIPTEQVPTLEYRFGVVDPSVNETVFINAFSATTTLNVALPVRGNNVTVVVECRSASGHAQQRKTFVTVEEATSLDLSNYVEKRNAALQTANNAEFESELTVICSAMPSIVETLDADQGSALISNLVNTMTARKDDLSVEMKVQSAKLLSNEVQLFDKESLLQLSTLLTDTMKGQNASHVLSDVISATKNFATVMIDEKSEKEEKLVFLALLDQVSRNVRNELQEGEQARLSMQHLEAVMAKTSARHPNASLVIPQQDRSSVLIQVRTASISTPQSASIDVQGQILDHPTEAYATKCDTTLVSPIISVQLFDPTQQQKIDELPGLDSDIVDEPIISTMINISGSMTDQRSSNSSSFALVCKYHVTSNDTWTMDNRVCRTVISPQDPSSVICMCNQPVTHAVSLDYIQSTTEDDGNGGTSSDGDTPCTNPCGCAAAPKPKLQTWAKVLIGVSVSFVACVIVALLAILGLIIVKRLFMKCSVPANQ